MINKNFRPVSNVQFTSKLTDKAVAVQLQQHMLVNGLFPELQSAYRQHHSTETSLLKVKNDLLMAMDKGQVTLLVLLHLSSAFDTVEHEILLERLRSTIGLRGKVLSWFESYLKGRSQQVSINGTLSKRFDLKCGVPQGSCLGPLLKNTICPPFILMRTIHSCICHLSPLTLPLNSKLYQPCRSASAMSEHG